jgi:hypothetical protein
MRLGSVTCIFTVSEYSTAELRSTQKRDIICPLGYPTTRIMNDLSDPGTPIVATATLVDGLVLALSAFSHSMNYRSYVPSTIPPRLRQSHTLTRLGHFRWDFRMQCCCTRCYTTDHLRRRKEHCFSKGRRRYCARALGELAPAQ